MATGKPSPAITNDTRPKTTFDVARVRAERKPLPPFVADLADLGTFVLIPAVKLPTEVVQKIGSDDNAKIMDYLVMAAEGHGEELKAAMMKLPAEDFEALNNAYFAYTGLPEGESDASPLS